VKVIRPEKIEVSECVAVLRCLTGNFMIYRLQAASYGYKLKSRSLHRAGSVAENKGTRSTYEIWMGEPL
jgi:hypothetical protein